MANDIKYLKSTDVVSSSVDIINNNFKSLKDAISANNVSIAKYDQDIQEAINKLKTDFDNVKCGLDKKIDTQSTSLREIEAKVNSTDGTVTSATITALATDIDGIKTALLSLQSKIDGIDNTSISSQLSLLTQRTSELETAVGTLESLITDDDGEEISAGIQTLSQRITTLEGTLEQAKTSLWAKINEHSASLDLCVTKDENGVIESGATLNADKINISGDHRINIDSAGELVINTSNFKLDESGNVSMSGAVTATSGTFNGTVNASAGSFTGNVNATSGIFRGAVYANSGTFNGAVYANSGTFNGAVYATSGSFKGNVTASEFSIEPSNGGSLTFKLWDSNDTSTYGSKYPVGTPVFIATDSNGKLYVVNMTELSTGSSSTTASVYLSNAYYLGSTITATDLVSATYNKIILKCAGSSGTVYRLNSETGALASGKYVTIQYNNSSSFVYIGSGYGPFSGYIACIPGSYIMKVHIFSNGTLASTQWMHIIPQVTYYCPNNDGVYYLKASDSQYLYVKTVTSMTGNTIYSIENESSKHLSSTTSSTWNTVTETDTSTYTLFSSCYTPKSGS